MGNTGHKTNPWDAYQSSLKSQGLFARALLAFSLMAALVLGLTAGYTLTNRQQMQDVLIANAGAALTATCRASHELIDSALLFALNQPSDIDSHEPGYQQTMASLHNLKNSVGAQRIYVVKQVGSDYLVIWDTAAEAAEPGDGEPGGGAGSGAGSGAGGQRQGFIPIELSATQIEAFTGTISINVHDPGSSTAEPDDGALALFYYGRVIGIVCVEFDNQSADAAYGTTLLSTNFLIGGLATAMAALLIASVALYRQNQKNQQHLFDMANKDAVTGLPNRRYLFDYLHQLIDQSEQALPAVAIFHDLDNFKSVNDGAGHAAGDQLLNSIGRYLSDCLAKVAADSQHECLTVRLGGDEFVQIMAFAEVAEAEGYIQEVMQGFAEDPGLAPFIQGYGISLSSGIAACPLHTTDSNDLVKFADIAMYHAKAMGKHTYRVYDPGMGSQVEGVTLSVRDSRKA